MIICLVGRSGVGKTTIFKKLLKEFNGKLNPVISYTTRPMRDQEVNNVDYIFVNSEEFKLLEANNLLVENITYNGNHYGFNRDFFSRTTPNIAIIEPVGLEQLKDNIDGYKFEVIKIDEDPNILRNRMINRGDDEEVIKERLELDNVRFGSFDYDYLVDSDYETTREIIVNLLK